MGSTPTGGTTASPALTCNDAHSHDRCLSGGVRLKLTNVGWLCPIHAQVSALRAGEGLGGATPSRRPPGRRCTWRRSGAGRRRCSRPTRRPGLKARRRRARRTQRRVVSRRAAARAGRPRPRRPARPHEPDARSGSTCSPRVGRPEHRDTAGRQDRHRTPPGVPAAAPSAPARRGQPASRPWPVLGLALLPTAAAVGHNRIRQSENARLGDRRWRISDGEGRRQQRSSLPLRRRSPC